MGSIESKVNVDAITKETNSHPVVVYTKDQCSFCTKAKNLLNGEKVEYREYNLDKIKNDIPKEYTSYVNGLVYKTRQTSVPQVFICGNFVGGFTELNKLHESRKLLEAISQCTGENA